MAPEARRAASKVLDINEGLADRFAWERIRPGHPLPLTKAGRLHADRIERSIEELSRFFTKGRFTFKPLDPGQYRHVPAHMLTWWIQPGGQSRTPPGQCLGDDPVAHQIGTSSPGGFNQVALTRLIFGFWLHSGYTACSSWQ